MAKRKADYNAAQIKVLKGLDGVRRRPAMYIGSTGKSGLHHILFEVIDNSIDEAFAEECDEVETIIMSDGSVSVRDNGRGIPVDEHPTEKRPALEVVMTTLHAGGKFEKGSYKVSGGLHGVGVSCTNALSEWCEVEVCRNGTRYYQAYDRGIPRAPMKEVGSCDSQGTYIRFLPDPEIFEDVEFEFETIAKRLKELAYLSPGLKLTLKDERPGRMQEETFQEKGGIKAYVEAVAEAKEALHKPIYFREEREDVDVEVAIMYTDGIHETIVSYVNSIHTTEGGTHLSGFKTATTRTINAYARDHDMRKEKERNFTGNEVREGLAAVISIKLVDPQFEGQTKTKLGNSEVDGLMNSVVGDHLRDYMEEHPTVARRIIKKATAAARASDAARKAAEATRKTALSTAGMPGKLADCSSRNPEECELFIVEGNSAGGNAKQARDSRNQAILPLRGVTINVEKSRLDKVLGNAEIRALITALGAGFSANGDGRDEQVNGDEEGGSRFDLEKLRYHRIIIMCDADIDGSHISALLLTFFFRYMQPLLRQGYVYVAKPPLFRIKARGETYYALNEAELEKLLEDIGTRNTTVNRFKGLSEMDAHDLADTTMDPKNRVLKQVTVDEAEEADRIISTLLGDDVARRRSFLVEHAKVAHDLDLWA
ncbi:MAG: DNA topoisomerase subunit B [Armatimonadota bacterium]